MGRDTKKEVVPKKKLTDMLLVMAHRIPNIIIHPHQRCGYSDSPFARRDTFSILQDPEIYTAGSRNELEGVGGGGHTHTHTHTHKKKRFSHRKIC